MMLSKKHTNNKAQPSTECTDSCFSFPISFDGDDGTAAAAASVASAGSSAGRGTKPPIMESLGEDGNINISNVTNAVVGKVGNLFGKGIGGIGSKLGGGGWF